VRKRSNVHLHHDGDTRDTMPMLANVLLRTQGKNQLL
jgi:hypothetical protein